MTNNEIASKFKRADGKKEQISILAQLNGCNEETIKQILIDEGIPEAEIQPVKKRRGRKPGIKNKVQPQSNFPSELIVEDERKRLPLSKCNRTYRTGDVLLQQPEDMTEEEKETLQHEQIIAQVYEDVANGKKFEKKVPLDIQITAYYPIPKSTSKKKRKEMLEHRIRPVVKPDLDNIAKLIYDALNGVAWHDDNAIVDTRICKFYSENPRVEIFIQVVDSIIQKQQSKGDNGNA